MNIAYITAGAGGMYCGSCLRDNALASELQSQGHEVHLIPIYTPTRTDESNVSEPRVFLGGVNMYLQQHLSLFRSTPEFLDRVWDTPTVLNAASRWGMSIAPEKLGEMTVSTLRGVEGFQSKEVHKLVQFLRDEIRPDVINLPNSLLIGLAPALKAELRCPVFVTLQGEDLFLSGIPPQPRAECIRLIRSAAESVDAFLAVSQYAAESMSESLGLQPQGILVAPLGINLQGYAADPPSQKKDPAVFTIGYLARIAPEKGLHVLCDAYRKLREHDDLPASRLLAAGYLAAAHRPYLEEARKKMADWGLSDQFEYRGELNREEKIEFLSRLSVFSVPSPYDEPKGLYLLEAMASGVPVVQPDRGAFPELIRKTGGGVLVNPDDPAALADAWLSLWQDPTLSQDLAAKAHVGVRAHYGAPQMAERVLGIYESFLAQAERPIH